METDVTITPLQYIYNSNMSRNYSHDPNLPLHVLGYLGKVAVFEQRLEGSHIITSNKKFSLLKNEEQYEWGVLVRGSIGGGGGGW